MLADQWFEAFNRATDAKKLRASTSLIFLIEKFQQYPESMDLQHLQDIESEERRLAQAIIKEQLLTNPDTVAAIVQECGFTLSPATVAGTSQHECRKTG